MSEDEERQDPFDPKRPSGMDRRSFVKTAMGAATVGAVGVGTAGLVVPLSTSGRLKIRRFPYLGARLIGGPAPQGLPLIPIRVNESGEVEGVPSLEESDVEHSLDWYKYCSHDEAPGLDPDFTDDNVLRYFNTETKLRDAERELGEPLWYHNMLDEPILAEHLTDVGMGAPFKWRSEDQRDTNIITGIVIKVDPASVAGQGYEPFMDPDHNLMGFCSFCAHFCCVPGYQESSIPRGKGLFDKIYCTCHDSVYDPSDIAPYRFPPNL